MDKLLKGVVTSTPLAGDATSSLTWKVPSRVTKVAIAVFADQTGTAFIDQSLDNTNWRAEASTPIVANTLLLVERRAVMPYVRFRVVNGATPQTVFNFAWTGLSDA